MDRDRPLPHTLLAALVVTLGCGPERWQAELSSNADAPLVAQRVTATRTTAVDLSAGGVTLTSSSPKNSVAFEVELTTREGLVDGALLGSRSACTVDGVVWATDFIGDAGRDDTRLGSRVVRTSQFMPNAFAAGPPSACEVELRVQTGRVGPGAPQFDPIDVARLCWTAEAGVVDGACAEAALPRTIPARAALVR
ncbi:MAG: hypothetical protein IAG13_08265, partial [Deltaproteobacteria bacterium]|nr:hypothetical protein [Nannocystaceae bacterium]